MSRKSLINDVNLKPYYSEKGSPITSPNIEIRQMLTLAKAGKDDVIWDLGCGYAQNLIVATEEFEVKKCIGVERLKSRCRIANERIKRRSLSNKITIINNDYEDEIANDDGVEKFTDATIVLLFFDIDTEIVKFFSKKLQEKGRLVYRFIHLVPEIKPKDIKYPFCVSQRPFEHPNSELDWLESVIKKSKSSLSQEKQIETKELWDELLHDYHVMGLTDDVGRIDVRKYKKRLKQFLKKGMTGF